MPEHIAHTSRLHALLVVVEEELLKLDEDKSGHISTYEVAALIKRLLGRLGLPWFVRAFLNKHLITLALEHALNFGSVAKKEQQELLAQKAVQLPSISRMAFVDDEAREALEIKEILEVRPEAVDVPEEDEAAFKAQLDKQDELLKMLRERKRSNGA